MWYEDSIFVFNKYSWVRIPEGLKFNICLYKQQNYKSPHKLMWASDFYTFSTESRGPPWLWSYGSWIYNYLCKQCPLLLKLWVQIPLRRGVLDTILCDKVCEWLKARRLFSPGTPVSSRDKTDWNIVEGGIKHHKP